MVSALTFVQLGLNSRRSLPPAIYLQPELQLQSSEVMREGQNILYAHLLIQHGHMTRLPSVTVHLLLMTVMILEPLLAVSARINSPRATVLQP